MARKAPISGPTFSPVKSDLVHAVLSRHVNSKPPPTTCSQKNASTRATTSPATVHWRREEPGPEPLRWRDKLTREKRLLLSRGEELAVNEFVLRLSSNGAASLKLSHLLRACIILLRHCEKELIDRVREGQLLVRPANDNLPAIAEFERRLAKAVAAAVRLAPPRMPD